MLASAGAAALDAPLPRPKPAVPAEVPAAEAPDVKVDAAEAALTEAACRTALAASQVEAAWIGTATEGGCRVAATVRLKSVASPVGAVAYPQGPVLRCDFAVRLGKWTREVAAPVAAAHLGRPLEAVITGPGLVCRNRVGGAEAKVSEHARGNAIDITGLRLADARAVAVGAGGGADAELVVATLRAAACGYFTTVLGPGSNAAHATHLHFDAAVRGRSGNHRLCE